jgi:hypothetical protein
MRVTTFISPLPEPIRILEKYLEDAGTSIIKAAFQYSFFIDPARVREKCPYYPDRARMSREHYPKGDRGERRQWKGSDVTLGDNARAQMAWEKYTGRSIARGTGYGVRHIWGLPWDPAAFTAGWNLCYMPFWLGMLTEDQHPHEDLLPAIQQASFDLYFRDDPVCEKPDYVIDHGIILENVLGDETIQILSAERRTPLDPKAPFILSGSPAERVIAIRKAKNASWSNLGKAISSLQGRPHEPFGTPNVASNSKSIARMMLRETGLTLDQLDNVVRELAKS